MEPAMSSDMLRTHGRPSWGYHRVTASVIFMSQLTAPRAPGHRLPYDDPSSLHDMFGDCVAAGHNLAGHAAPPPVIAPHRAPAPAIAVPAETARKAGALHLHLH